MTNAEIKSQHISNIAYSYMSDLEGIYQNTDTKMGICTGIDVLDEELKGINPKDLVLIGVYPYSDNEFFIRRLIVNAAEKFKEECPISKEGKNVLFFTLDCSAKFAVRTMICIKNEIAVNEFNEDIKSYEQFEKLMNYKSNVDDLPIYINNNSYSLQDIQTEVQKFGYEKVGLIVIESLQELNDYQDGKDMRPFFSELKVFAERHNISVIITCRLKGTDGYPSLDDMPCSNASIYMDKILFLKSRAIDYLTLRPLEAEYDCFEKYQEAYNIWETERKQNKNRYDILIKKVYDYKSKHFAFNHERSLGLFEYRPNTEYEIKLNYKSEETLKNFWNNENIKPNCVFSATYKSYTQFNPNLLNTDIDLKNFDNLISKTNKRDFSLCLYGASGTGKTAYANHLAEVMGLQAITKYCSDMLKPYIGETESKIAAAFKEACDKKAVLIFDEADSFLQDRRNASRNWEITQVNEMLTQMEKHPYPIICTTNLMENIDVASLRRFTFKIKYDYMTSEQVKQAFLHFFNMLYNGNDDLKLTPGDFNVVRRKADILGLLKKQDKIIEMLKQEQQYRISESTKIGFI